MTLDIAKINCAAWIQIENRVCTDVRVAVGSAAPTVVRAFSVEKILKGQEPTAELIGRAAFEVADDIFPITDIRSSDKYRKKSHPYLYGMFCRKRQNGQKEVNNNENRADSQ